MRLTSVHHLGCLSAMLVALGGVGWSCTRGYDEKRSRAPAAVALGSKVGSASQLPGLDTSFAGASAPIAPGDLGFASVPKLPSPEAVAANNRGFAEYQKKRLESALLHFEKAVEKAPDFDLARYNAMAMLALLGRHEESAIGLASLLRRDLPRFYPRLLADPDFEVFRGSATGKSLLRDTESLREVWLGLAKTGVPMTAYASHRRGYSAGAPEIGHQRPDWFRAGVWLPSAKRFLALIPPLPHALGAVLNPALGRALVVDAEINLCRTDFCPRLDRARIFDFSQFVPATLPKTPLTVEANGFLFGVRVELTARGSRWLANNRTSEEWYEANDGRIERARVQAASEWLGLNVGILGGHFVHIPKGWAQVNRDILLPDGRRIKLPARDSWAALELVEIPTRDQAILVVVRAGCECNKTEASILEYAIEVLDLLKLTVTPWDQGKGMAAASVDANRRIYLQRNERLEQFERAGDKIAAEQLPSGMLLCPPMIPDDNCCGL